MLLFNALAPKIKVFRPNLLDMLVTIFFHSSNVNSELYLAKSEG